MIKIDTTNFTRINKKVARRLFDEGKIIAVTPYLYNPEGAFTSSIHKSRGDFDTLVNNATYYAPTDRIDFYLYKA